jgi:hypothetical protein
MTFAPGPDMLLRRHGCSAVALEGNPRRALIVGQKAQDENFNRGSRIGGKSFSEEKKVGEGLGAVLPTLYRDDLADLRDEGLLDRCRGPL